MEGLDLRFAMLGQGSQPSIIIIIITDWFKSAQVLYALAVFLIVVSSAMVFIAACLRDNIYSKVAKAAGSLMIIAGTLYLTIII